MPKIKYEFADGTSSEPEVNEELYLQHLALVQKEKRNHWTQTRRHDSLESMLEEGDRFGSDENDPLSRLVRREENKRYEDILGILNEEQRELLETVYIDGISIAEIARKKKLAYTTIHTKINRIIKKLKKFL